MKSAHSLTLSKDCKVLSTSWLNLAHSLRVFGSVANAEYGELSGPSQELKQASKAHPCR